jgi:hypothetical protein
MAYPFSSDVEKDPDVLQRELTDFTVIKDKRRS